MKKLSLKQFRLLNVEGSVRKTQSMFVGGSNHVLIPKLKKRKLCNVVEDYYCFKGCVHYCTAAKYILSKFLTNSKLLMSLSAVDPITFSVGQSKTQHLLKEWFGKKEILFKLKKMKSVSFNYSKTIIFSLKKYFYYLLKDALFKLI